jgi:peptidoglycan-N-acetylglucosamine deacetylase
MPDRWSWDFEDEPARSRPAPDAGPASATEPRPSTPAPGGGGPPRGRAEQIRRRRAAALLAALVVVVIAVVVASSSGGAHRSPASRSAGRAHVAPKPISDPEADQLAAVRSTLAYTPFIKEGGAKGRDIALTFDDGPGPYTPQVLAVLEQYHVKATFFVIGRMLRYFGQSTVREIEAGDVIGDHTENHPMLARMSRHDQFEEMFEQGARVELLGARRPVLFRPPYGSFDATTFQQLHKLHQLMVLWSVDTDDFEQPGTSVIVQRALEGAHPGAIILLHDAGGTRTQTIEALPLIIKGLRAKGYDLVTVPKLLEDDPPPAGQPIPSSLSGD